MENISQQNEINTLKSEHLTNGERPIIACVDAYSADQETEFSEEVKHLIKNTKAEVVSEENAYSISRVSSKDKVSSGYIMCTGTAGIGKDKWTDENISFLSHQFPGLVLPGEALHEKFLSDFRSRLVGLKEKCALGSIDVVIVGGEYWENSKRSVNRYSDSINMLKEEVVKIFGFEPVVITGPKIPSSDLPGNTEAVFLDTKNRRLYISRAETGTPATESFMAGDIESQKEKWGIEPK